MFCSCAACQNIRSLGRSEYRTRTQIFIDDDFSVDFPPEAYVHSLEYGVNFSRLKYLFVTHSHMDHFYAHDFILRGYKYAELIEERLRIYGNAEVHRVFNECTAREMKAQVVPHLAFEEIVPFQCIQAGDYRVLTLPANHKTVEDALLFYIEKGGKGYLHLHDTGLIGGEALDFLAANGVKAQAVTFDCTFVDKSYGADARHMGIKENMTLKGLLQERGIIDGRTKLIITHFSHNANPTRAHLKEIEEQYGVIAAYDGMSIEI